MADTTAVAKPPHLFWTLTEWRAAIEFASFSVLRNVLKRLPKGDGHPVLVLPGFMASDRSTRPMRNLLDDLGYQSYGWNLGYNVRFDSEREAQMLDLLGSVHERTEQKVSIVGWSLGGVFARELTKIHPDKVRSVISLGSPISNDRRYSAPSRLFEAINGRKTEPEEQGRYRNLEKAPPVPTTSILTKSDGVVSWRGSVQKPDDHDQIENIMVPASHIGLGVNPLVMVAIADRLAQPEGEWKPFNRRGWRELLFKHPPKHSK